jgi:hypothetical protein
VSITRGLAIAALSIASGHRVVVISTHHGLERHGVVCRTAWSRKRAAIWVLEEAGRLLVERGLSWRFVHCPLTTSYVLEYM